MTGQTIIVTYTTDIATLLLEEAVGGLAVGAPQILQPLLQLRLLRRILILLLTATTETNVDVTTIKGGLIGAPARGWKVGG